MEMRNIRRFRRSQRLALYQGTTFSRAAKAQTELGFSPCAFSLFLAKIHGTAGLLLQPSKLAFGASFALAGAEQAAEKLLFLKGTAFRPYANA